MEDDAMMWSSCVARPTLPTRCVSIALLSLLTIFAGSNAQAQDQTGSIGGRVLDDQGTPLVGAQVAIPGSSIGTQTRANGEYVLPRVPVGSHSLQARYLGYRPETATIQVTANQRSYPGFHPPARPASAADDGRDRNAVSPHEPRRQRGGHHPDRHRGRGSRAAKHHRDASLRAGLYPGGELRRRGQSEHLACAASSGVEYVAFLEDGMPVFPTMHTFFMNADNLFRFDTNIERMEVVRGGSSPLFGSNTPGAIVNFINKTGGDSFGGTMRGHRGHARAWRGTT